MSRRPTMDDVATTAGVSKTTVSRVLNGRPDVDSGTVARVRAAVARLEYVKSARAVQLARGTSDAIGVLAPFLTAPWMIEVLRGASDEIERVDYSLTLHTFARGVESLERFGAQIRGGMVDGLLVVAPVERLAVIDWALDNGLPVIVLDDNGHHRNIYSVEPREETGVVEAVEHLHSIGRRRVAVITGSPEFAVSEGRLHAYRTALATHSMPLKPSLVVASDFTEAGGRSAVEQLLKSGAPFDALAVCSDEMAVGAMRGLRAAGRAIPDDVSVIGFDDFPTAQLVDPQLTTIHNPLYERTRLAMRMLIAAATSGKPFQDEPVVVDTHLVIRESSQPRKPSAPDDPARGSSGALDGAQMRRRSAAQTHITAAPRASPVA